jgi:hypothetical protein
MNRGIELTARYAYGCQAVPPGSRLMRKIDHYLRTGRNEEEVRSGLTQLEPWRYYWFRQDAKYPKPKNEATAAAVRSYWLGTPVLFSPLSSYCFLITPPKMNQFMNEKRGSCQLGNVGACIFLHQGVRPYHNFVVLAKTALTGLEIPAVLGLANSCMISLGKVKRVLGDQLIVAWRPLLWTNNRLRWGRLQMIRVKRGYVKKIRVGDVVSLHYNEVREVLTEAQQKQLTKYTQLAVNHLNHSFAQAKRDKKKKGSSHKAR